MTVVVHYARRKRECAKYGEGQDVPQELLEHNGRVFKGVKVE
jgi:hypothetical protein